MPVSVSKEPSQRQLRVAQEIKKIIAGALQRGEVRNPLLLDNLITITDVDISPDLMASYKTVKVINFNIDDGGINSSEFLEKISPPLS